MLRISLNSLVGGTAKQKEMYKRALGLLERAVNSQEFKNRVLNYNYVNNGVLINSFKNNQSKTNQQVYDLIMSGYDKYNKTKDGDIDISVELYFNRWSGVLGYTYPSTIKTWVNTKFWIDESVIAGNCLHEYCHNVGFDHAFKYNPTRKHSIPYALGFIASDIVKEYLEPVSYGNGINTVIKKSTWSRIVSFIKRFFSEY